MIRKFMLVGALVALGVAPAIAQEAKVPQENLKKPSEILLMVEGRPDFSRLVDMSWNNRGYYEIEYRTTDKARVEINIDAKSGEPVEQD